MSNEDKSVDNLVSVNIDGKDYDVPTGITMIEAAAIAGKEIPHFCYHPKLSVSGNCRMCLVEMGMPMRDRGTGEPVLDDDGKQKIGWMPKPGIACNSKTAPGFHIKTDTEIVREGRKAIMEFLLVNHPLDCPICDQAGECTLQEHSSEYGRGYSRFIEHKNVKPKRTKLGPRVTLDDERCILCSRCVRFSKEVANDDVLGFIDRGSYSTLTCYPGKDLRNNYSLNTVDICPVGALTGSDFRFNMRVWFLKQTKSICTESSSGANTVVWSREGKIYRITPRRNDEVNDTWMTDSGRMIFKQVEEKRLSNYEIEGETVSSDAAISKVSELLKDKKVGMVVSAQSSVEEQFVLNELKASLNANVFMKQHTADEDGILLTADRTPNLRGALVTGLTDSYPEKDWGKLKQSIQSGDIETLLVFNENLFDQGFVKEDLDKVNVVYCGTHENRLSKVAKVNAPLLMVFEKDGTFINQQFRLQKFNQAVPGEKDVLNDLTLINQLQIAVTGESESRICNTSVWNKISQTIDSLSGISFNEISEEGVSISGKAFAELGFVEEKTLKFDKTKFQF